MAAFMGYIQELLLISTALHIILFPFVIKAQTCNGVEDFLCTNQQCINIALRDNEVNDCGDNSDEGFQGDCALKDGQYQFKCTEATSGALSCKPLSFVHDGTPDCPDGSDEYKVLGDKCGDAISPTACCPCEDYIDESECSEGACVCKSGRYGNTLGTDCIVRVMFDPCVTDPDCYDAIDHTACPSGFCICDHGYHRDTTNTSCIQNIIYDYCEINIDCSNVMAHSNCGDNMCLCNSGYHPNSDNTTCIKNRIGDPCTQQSDCTNVIDHSLCSAVEGNTCQCEFTYQPYNVNTECVVYLLTDTCYNETQCDFGVSNSNCTNSTCYCNSGYIPNEDTRDECTLRKIGDPCELQTDCSDAVTHSYCNNTDLCDCVDGYMVSEDRSQCIRRQLNDLCTENTDCDVVIPLSECSTGSCQCIAGAFNPNGTLAFCQMRIIGDPCTENSDCTDSFDNSECSSNTCQCKDEYLPGVNNTSCSLRILSSPCEDDDQCQLTISYSVCEADICACDEGYFQTDDTVCSTRPLGESCSHDLDCKGIPGSECSGGVCACLDGYYQANSTSCIARGVGDACTDKYIDCAAIPTYALCIDGTCQCATAQCSQPYVNSFSCLTTDYCREWIDNTACENGVCVCPTGYYENGDSRQCLAFALGTSGCNTAEDCYVHVPNSYCNLDAICACGTNYEQSGTQCLLIEASISCDTFICKYAWLVAVIVVVYVIIMVLIICLCCCSKKKNKNKKSWQVNPDEKNEKCKKLKIPIWQQNLKTKFPVMYKSDQMNGPQEVDILPSKKLETLAFAGGAQPTYSSPPESTTPSSRPTSAKRPYSSTSSFMLSIYTPKSIRSTHGDDLDSRISMPATPKNQSSLPPLTARPDPDQELTPTGFKDVPMHVNGKVVNVEAFNPATANAAEQGHYENIEVKRNSDEDAEDVEAGQPYEETIVQTYRPERDDADVYASDIYVGNVSEDYMDDFEESSIKQRHEYAEGQLEKQRKRGTRKRKSQPKRPKRKSKPRDGFS